MVQQKLVGGWEHLKPLGEGGQSKVFLVRSPGRVQERRDVIQEVLGANPWTVAMSEQERPEKIDRLAMSLWKYARPDEVSELGALKIFKIPENGLEAEEALGRLKNEISVLRQGKSGLVKLFEANEADRWVVTEFMPSGTLERHPTKFKGNAYAALKAFRTLVNTVASLHKENIVHRDIKRLRIRALGLRWKNTGNPCEIRSSVFDVLTMLKIAVCGSASLLFAVSGCFRFPSPTPACKALTALANPLQIDH